ncbi:MAG: Maf family protein, partial [Sphingomonas sp.]|nr:Maf family protein [Sphingomonas sp.]
MTLILASQSASRQAMLTAAGVSHRAVAAHIDEQAIKAAMHQEGAAPRAIADALAALKARRVADSHPGDTVIGSDSILVLGDGRMPDKPIDRADARAQLGAMSAGRHSLISAVVIVEGAREVWRHVDVATLS